MPVAVRGMEGARIEVEVGSGLVLRAPMDIEAERLAALAGALRSMANGGAAC